MSLIYGQTTHCEEVWEEVRLIGRILWARIIVGGQYRIMRAWRQRRTAHSRMFSHDSQHYTDIPDASFGISSASVMPSTPSLPQQNHHHLGMPHDTIPEPLYREDPVYHSHNAMATLPTYHRHATNGGGGSHYNTNTGIMNPNANGSTSVPADFWRRIRGGMGMSSSPGGTKPKNV
jgi:hypothetical protein